MGEALADHLEQPRLARLICGDVVIYGGDACHTLAPALVETMPTDKGIWPVSHDWEALIRRIHGRQIVSMTRYAFGSEALDPGRLRNLSHSRPSAYRVAGVDLALAQRITTDPALISGNHYGAFDSLQDVARYGLGFCILLGDQIVSCATTYAASSQGIEVQINTHPLHQRRGLATIVAAHLILESLHLGLEPHWDAANAASAKLAQRLGYMPAGTYEMLVLVA